MLRYALLLSAFLLACNGGQQDCPDSAKILVYADADRDGYGDDLQKRMVCEVGPMDATVGGDCDDTRSNVHPGALEECDGLDNNCNGEVDEGLRQIRWYADEDGDGFGSRTKYVEACTAPPGYVDNNTDCHDNDPDSFPGGREVCDGKDNNCDGLIDDQDPETDPDSMTLWYVDADGDGYGDPSTAVPSCKIPFPGAVTNGRDCDDTNPDRNPDAIEICNGVDDDCDGHIDDSDDDIDPASLNVWYFDGDGDGYGDDANTVLACDAPWFYVGTPGDCDDTNPLLGDASTGYWVVDADGDGFGDPDATLVGPQCNAPAGHVLAALALDCDDDNSTIHPEATEICDGLDNDCDGLIDDEDDEVDLTDGQIFYLDADEDGFGDPDNTVLACAQPTGTVTDATDCDDTRAEVNPDATEICNGLDDDCNELIDEEDPGLDESSFLTWFEDLDQDGWGNPDVSVLACSPPDGFVGNDLDCDDIDEESAAFLSWYEDLDGDGFGAGDPFGPSCEPPEPEGWVTELQPLDCDDEDDQVHPFAEEICGDGIDQNCDGVDDECPLLMGDTCAEAMLLEPLTTGEHHFDADLSGYINDVSFTASNICTGKPTAGAEAFLPVVLEPGEALYATYDQVFDGSLYLVPDCTAPTANDCLLGADNVTDNGGVEQLWYLNSSASRQSFYLVADCSTALCGAFTLDIKIEPGPDQWLPDTCAEAGAFEPLTTGGYSMVGDNTGLRDDLFSTSCFLWWAEGPETIVPVELLPGESIWVRYQQPAADAILYMVSDCTAGGTCVNGSDSSFFGGFESFLHTNNTGSTQQYYVVADCWTYYPSDPCGKFRLGIGIE